MTPQAIFFTIGAAPQAIFFSGESTYEGNFLFILM